MAYRIGILATHPVQYHSPWFRHLSEKLDLTVYYAHRQSRREQAAAGFDVEFEWDVDLLEGYEYEWLDNGVDTRRRPGFFRYSSPDIREIVEKGAFSGFLVFGWNYLSAWQACSACVKSAVPVLMRGDSQLRNRRSPLTLFLKRLSYPYGLGRFSGHLYVGARNREYLVNYGVPDTKLFFAPHFVDCAFFKNRADAADASGHCSRIRKEKGIPEDAFVYAFVGKLIEKKRPEDFLAAIKALLQQREGRDVHALIVGDGALADSLKRSAESLRGRVHFTGFVNQFELPAYYRVADALVLPSDARESWGLVVNEAAACGRPAIVTEEVGCRPDLIDNELTGFSYRLGDRDALVNRMVSLKKICIANGDDVRRALAANSSQYSISSATDGLMSALRDTCERQ